MENHESMIVTGSTASSSASPENPRELPLDYSWIVFRASWKLLPHQYGLLLLTVIIVMCAGTLLHQVDFVGPVVSTILSAFIAPGLFLILKNISEKKPTNLGLLFFAFQNEAMTKKLIPYVIANTGISLLLAVLSWAMLRPQLNLGDSLTFVIPVLTFIWTVLNFFSIPLMLFKNRTYVETFSLNIAAFTSNLRVVFLYVLCTVMFVFACTMALVLPVIFVALPMLQLNNYLLYAALFENLELEKVEVKPEIKSETQAG